MGSHTIYKSIEGKKTLQDLYERALETFDEKFERMFVPTRFGNTHVLISGPESAPPVFVLQGGNTLNPITLSWFKPLLGRFRIYAPDTIGHPGYSEETRVSAKDANLSHWVTDIMDHFGLQKAIFIGTSYGGGIILRIAATSPERISKAVLVAPAGITLGSKWDMIKRIMVPLIKFKLSTNSKHIATMLNEMATDSDQLNLDVLQAVFQHSKLEQDMPKITTKQELARFKAPTLVFAGTQDPFFPADRMVSKAKQIMPHARIEILEGKHFPSTSRLEYINNEIIQFLTSSQDCDEKSGMI